LKLDQKQDIVNEWMTNNMTAKGFLRVPTVDELQKEYAHLLDRTSTVGDRSEALTKLFHELADRVYTAPASGKYAFHHAFPGGWMIHTLNVVNNLLKLIEFYENAGGRKNISKEDAIFCALVHDLGKLGDEKEPMYLEETSTQWIEKGYLYKRNPIFTKFSTNDLTFHLLQHFGIKVTLDEMVAIKCTDGLYAEGNKAYLMGNNPFPFENNLPYLLHWADHMATIVEKDEARVKLMRGK
jgi:hypothetical protein